MKKSEQVETPLPAVSLLGPEVQRRELGAAAAEAAIVARLQEQAADSVAAGRTALETYAAMEHRYGPWLQVELGTLKNRQLGPTRWGGKIQTARAEIEELLRYLEVNPDRIRHHLAELAEMTSRQAQSHRPRQLCDWVSGMADTAAQFPKLVDGARARLTELKPLLEQEQPDFAPQMGLAPAASDASPPRSRVAKHTLSGVGDE